MQHVKMFDDVVDVARRAADRWYVTMGHAAVGPVNLDLLARGVEAGKVPLDAFVRHEAWKVWRPLSDIAVIEDGEGTAAPLSTDDIADLARPSTPADFGPVDLFFSESSVDEPGPAPADAGTDLRDALTLLMTAAVARGGADAAIVHAIDDDGAVAVCAHGPSRSAAVGLRTPRLDAALAAAEAGATVIADAGPAGASICARLGRIAGPVEGALLIPIRTRGRLMGLIEIGRRAPFSAAEVASLEALVSALADTLDGSAG